MFCIIVVFHFFAKLQKFSWISSVQLNFHGSNILGSLLLWNLAEAPSDCLKVTCASLSNSPASDSQSGLWLCHSNPWICFDLNQGCPDCGPFLWPPAVMQTSCLLTDMFVSFRRSRSSEVAHFDQVRMFLFWNRIISLCGLCHSFSFSPWWLRWRFDSQYSCFLQLNLCVS